MVQKRWSVAAATPIPSWGMSLSRKVLMKSRRHAALALAVLARKERGKPPRSQSWSSRPAPTSSTDRPPSSMNATRPASDSEAPRIRPGDALPRSRNRAGRRGRSARTRRIGKSDGRRWISSRTSVSVASPSRAMSRGSSRSKWTTGPFQRALNCFASVVFPTWRAPRIATMGLPASNSSRCLNSQVRLIIERMLP